VRLLFAHPHTSWNGVRRGGERYLDDLVTHAVAAGHEVRVATATPGTPRRYRRAGARVDELAVPAGHGADEAFGAAVEGLLRAEPCDVVHALEAPAALGAAAAGVPAVLSVLGLPRSPWLAARPSYRAQLAAAGRGAAVVCALGPTAARAVAEATGIEVVVLPPGVRTAAFPLDRRPRDGRTVLFAGAVVEPRKRFADLVAALADVPAAALVVAGPGDPGPALRRVPAVAARTTVLPVQDRDELPALYAAAAVTAVPSVDEAFGLVAVESLACGTPVLAAPGSGPEEIIGGAPVGSVGVVTDDLAAGLRDLLERPRDPQACRDRAQRYDWARIGPEHEAVWRRARERAADRPAPALPSSS
jgi:glycosyltransferase involved in cell wall biosynthesis